MTHPTGAPTDRRPPFGFSAWTRVGFSDTDAQGIVYYGRYLPYFDAARVEYLRHLDLLGRERDTGYEFVMRACSIEYHAPARFDDLVEVFVRLARLGRTSATFEFAAYRAADDVLMVTATQTLVLVDLEERRPVPIPDESGRAWPPSRARRSRRDGRPPTRARSRRSSGSSTAAGTATRFWARSSASCTSASGCPRVCGASTARRSPRPPAARRRRFP